jgi:hypothetical protein
MSNKEQEAFFAGIVEARGTAYIQHSNRGKRPHLEVMFRDPQTAEAFRDHFGGSGQIREETPRYGRDVRNQVYRVRGLAALDIIRRVLPYLQGRSAEDYASVLERCSKVA